MWKPRANSRERTALDGESLFELAGSNDRLKVGAAADAFVAKEDLRDGALAGDFLQPNAFFRIGIDRDLFVFDVCTVQDCQRTAAISAP